MWLSFIVQKRLFSRLQGICLVWWGLPWVNGQRCVYMKVLSKENPYQQNCRLYFNIQRRFEKRKEVNNVRSPEADSLANCVVSLRKGTIVISLWIFVWHSVQCHTSSLFYRPRIEPWKSISKAFSLLELWLEVIILFFCWHSEFFLYYDTVILVLL